LVFAGGCGIDICGICREAGDVAQIEHGAVGEKVRFVDLLFKLFVRQRNRDFRTGAQHEDRVIMPHFRDTLDFIFGNGQSVKSICLADFRPEHGFAESRRLLENSFAMGLGCVMVRPSD
jgi:hypothetical protein